MTLSLAATGSYALAVRQDDSRPTGGGTSSFGHSGVTLHELSAWSDDGAAKLSDSRETTHSGCPSTVRSSHMTGQSSIDDASRGTSVEIGSAKPTEVSLEIGSRESTVSPEIGSREPKSRDRLYDADSRCACSARVGYLHLRRRLLQERRLVRPTSRQRWPPGLRGARQGRVTCCKFHLNARN